MNDNIESRVGELTQHGVEFEHSKEALLEAAGEDIETRNRLSEEKERISTTLMNASKFMEDIGFDGNLWKGEVEDADIIFHGKNGKEGYFLRFRDVSSRDLKRASVEVLSPRGFVSTFVERANGNLKIVDGITFGTIWKDESKSYEVRTDVDGKAKWVKYYDNYVLVEGTAVEDAMERAKQDGAYFVSEFLPGRQGKVDNKRFVENFIKSVQSKI